MLSESIEDYLKAIYKIEGDEPVTTNDLAASLNVAPSSVTKMIKRLDEMELVNYTSHKGVELTDKGKIESLRILRRHRIIETFLHDILGYSWDEVHDEANKLEHYISERFEEAIYKLSGYPKVDPHGDPIPDKEGNLPDDTTLSIVEAELNKKVKISRIMPDDTELLQYLGSLGLVPGAVVKVLEKHPFGGPIVIQKDSKKINLGMEAAKYIWVIEA